MRMTLLNLHDQTGEPAPLCRLQAILKEHADALAAAYPNDPEMLEIRSVRARHDEVTQHLLDYRYALQQNHQNQIRQKGVGHCEVLYRQ